VPVDLYATAHWARSTRMLASIAGILGRRDDAARYGALAEAIVRAFRAAYVADAGAVAGETQAGYALALGFDLLPEAQRPAAADRLAAALDAYGGRLSTGFMTTPHLLLALSRHGHAERAYGLALSREIPSWGYMLKQGATTIWERWDGYVEGRGFQDARMNSLCHYAIGSLSEWVFRVVGGLEPLAAHPGWKRFEVRPVVGGGLTWARAEHECIRGLVRSSWELEGERVRLRVTVPSTSTAVVHVPGGDVVEVGPGDHELEGHLAAPHLNDGPRRRQACALWRDRTSR
jgi:alpha-L-rhamnosidase